MGGGGHTYFDCHIGFACIRINNVSVYCSKLMLDYFGISNMYVNHVIIVIWVLFRAVFSETKLLFSAFCYLFDTIFALIDLLLV